MSLHDYESSIDKGQPVLLFEFSYGGSQIGVPGTIQTLRYTNAEKDITHDGHLYTASVISPSSVVLDGRLEDGKVQIKVPSASELGGLFSRNGPVSAIFCLIRQGHIANPDDPPGWDMSGDVWPAVYSGKVVEGSGDPQSAETTIVCDPTQASLDRVGLHRHYQYPCPHVLYGPVCRANTELHRVNATVATIEGPNVTLTAGWLPAGRAEDEYIGGRFVWDTEFGNGFRTIIRIDGWIFTVDGPVTGLNPGAACYIFPGCRRTMTDCRDLHQNIQNFGGFPWIPKKNPVNKNNHSGDD